MGTDCVLVPRSISCGHGKQPPTTIKLAKRGRKLLRTTKDYCCLKAAPQSQAIHLLLLHRPWPNRALKEKCLPTRWYPLGLASKFVVCAESAAGMCLPLNHGPKTIMVFTTTMFAQNWIDLIF